MLTSAALNLLIFLLPSYQGIVSGLAILFFVALVSAIGYLLFGSETEEHHSFRGYWRLLWPSGLSVIAGQYAGMLANIILAFVLSEIMGGAVNSEIPFGTSADLTVNLIFMVFTCAVCAFLSFAGGYWIALKKRIPEPGKRLGFCLVNSIAYGAVLFMSLVLSNMIM